MSSTSTGRKAEDAAVEYLRRKGYKILDQNWRKPQCEIDIVAKKNNRIYFVEVKYRKSDDFGGGLEYITPKKQKQMDFAAKMWCAHNNWTGDFSLSAVEVTGPTMTMTEFLSEI